MKLRAAALFVFACGLASGCAKPRAGDQGYEYVCKIKRLPRQSGAELDVVAELDYYADTCMHIVEAWNADEFMTGGSGPQFSCDCAR